MPKYSLPPLQDSNSVEAPEAFGGNEYPDQWARSITVPVNETIMDALEVGGMVEVTLRGTLTELTSNQSANNNGRVSMEVLISDVEAYMEDGGEDAFEASFNRRRGNYRNNF